MAEKPLDDGPGAVSPAAPAPGSPASIPQNPDSAVAAVQADQPAAAPVAAAPASQDAGAAASPDTPEGLGPTLLEQAIEGKDKPADKPASEAKPAEAKPADKPGDKPAAEAKPAEATAPQPAEPVKVDYFAGDLKIPETIKISDAQRGEVANALDMIRSGKTVEGMQALVGLHEKAMTDFAKQTVDDQWSAFRKTNEDWRTSVMSDPILGGAGHQTAMAAVARMRDRFVSNSRPGTPEYQRDMKGFDDFLRVTGAGNHPAFLHFVHNVAHDFDEPRMPPADIRPTKDNGRAPGDKRSRMYPTMQKGS